MKCLPLASLALVFALFGAAASACGGDDDDDNVNPVPPTPPTATLACGWGEATGGVELRPVGADIDFVAFGSDFKGFRSWPSFTIPGAPDLSGAHLAGDRTVYINRLPPADATEFPKGTVIVKATGGAEPKLFAMAKRGNNYNDTGAIGWEWFEVRELAGDTVMDVEWHGFGPPDGEEYAGNAEGGCNGCHAASVHDGVLSSGACAN